MGPDGAAAEHGETWRLRGLPKIKNGGCEHGQRAAAVGRLRSAAAAKGRDLRGEQRHCFQGVVEAGGRCVCQATLPEPWLLSTP